MEPTSTFEPSTNPTEPVEPVDQRPSQPKKKTGLWLALLVLAAVVVGGGAWAYQKSQVKPAAAQRIIKVGVLEDLTGDFATYGKAFKEGTELAQRNFSAPNVTIQLVPNPTLCDIAKAPQTVKDLAAQGVVAIIGDGCSKSMLALAPTANSLHVVMVSPSATNPDITTKGGDYLFRVIPSDALAADYTAQLLHDKGIKRLAILSSNESYGNGLSAALTASYTKLGGTVVASESLGTESSNVASQMVRVKQAKPDAIYLALIGGNALPAAILQQRQALGLTAPVYSSETLKDPLFLKDAGSLAEGLSSIAVSDGSTNFIEQTQAAYGKNPGLFSAQAYDAYTAIFKAVASGATTGPEIKDALYKVNFRGATGTVKFDANGDVPANYTVYKVVGGKFVAQ